MRLDNEENIGYLQKKVPFILIAIFLFVAAVLSRLYYLQVIRGEHYQKLAQDILVREQEIKAQRGDILDRSGVLLADSRTYFELTYTPQYVENPEETLAFLAKLVPVDLEKVKEILQKNRYEAKFRPIVIAEDIPYDWVAKIKENKLPPDVQKGELPLHGVDVQSYPLRRYLFPETFSHSLGYLTEIDKKKLEKAQTENPGVFSRGDLIGASGIEKAYDLELRGRDGVFAHVVDARGREVKADEDIQVLIDRSSLQPKTGLNLVTTLDFDAQWSAREAMGNYRGAVVALDPNTGEVLALFSTPGYDANRITKNVDRKYWSLINLHESKMLFNRTIQAMYPPASTYKIVGVTAGIEEGHIDPEKTVHICRGGMQFGNRFFKCWRSGGHGRVDAIRALGQSCDVFFYKVGLQLGVNGLAKYAKMFGFSQKTGIEIPYEQSGLIPTEEWKERRFKQKWYESETLSVSIGQSFNLTTPLQNAVAAAMVANGGYKVTPHLAKAFVNQQGEVIKNVPPQKEKTELAGSKGLEWAKKGMIEVVHGAGTAGRLRQSRHKIAGKTGTAQVIGHGRVAKKGVNTENHALFISFAPYDDPKIAVAVMVEHGRGGSSTAAPVAMKVIDAYLDKLIPEEGAE